MMNPMPMPSGPAETPGSIMKAERQTLKSERGGGAKGDNSFASTLKAVHDHNRVRDDSSKARIDDTRVEQEVSENETDLAHVEGEVAAADEKQAEPSAIQEMPRINADPAAMVPPAVAESTGDLGIPPEETPVEGTEEKAVPQAEGPSKKATQASKMGFAVVPKETGVEGGEAVKPMPRGMTAAPSNPTESPATDAVAVPKTGNGAITPAGTVDQTAQDRPGVKNADGTLAPLQDAGEEGAYRADNAVSASEGDLGEGDAPDEANFAKLLLNRDATRSREDSKAATPRPMSEASAEMPSGRSATGEGFSEQHKSSGGEGRETPLTAMKEDPSNAAARQGATDTLPSFSTTTATGKADAPAPTTVQATATTTAERFHQDNFHQMVERAVFAMRGEQSEARIALKPDQLGHVQMRIVTENHLVSIKILTESPVVRDLIDANAHQLKSELQQQGLTVENIEVSVSDDQRDAYRGARQRESFLRQLASQGQRRGQEEDLPRPRQSLGRHRPGRGPAAGIDYFA